jgi:photosystem II stability/assembly factor-like uncharacterized protein
MRLRQTARGALATFLLSVAAGLGWFGAHAPPAFAHTPHDTIADIALSPDFERDQTVYTIAREYLLESTDAGATWRRLVRGLDNKAFLSAIEVSRQDPSVLYAASRGDGVYKSTDAGETWQRVNSGLAQVRNVAWLAVSPHSDAVLLAASPRGGLARTANGGASWTEIQVRGEHVTAVAFAPDRPGLVYAGDAHGGLHASDDDGATWRPLPGDLGGDAGAINALAIAVDATGDRVIFVGTAAAGVFESRDGGDSFAAGGDGITDPRIISVLASQNFDKDQTLWVSTWNDGVFRSDDADATWTRTSDGLSTNEQADLLDHPQFGQLVAPQSGDDPTTTVFLGGFDGLFTTTDGAGSWEQVQTQSASNIQSIELSPSYLEDGTILVTTYINGAFRSDDRGASWKAINRGLAARFLWTRREDYIARLTGAYFSPDFPESRRTFASGRGYWFVSDDAGDQWQPTTPPGVVVKDEFPPDYFLPVFSPAFDEDREVFLGTDGGKIYRSTDGGSRFTKIADLEQTVDAIVISPEFAADRTLVVGTRDGVLKSVDAGRTWQPSAPLSWVTSVAISPEFGRDRRLFVGTERGLFLTDDAGRAWTEVPGAPFGNSPYVESVVVSPDYANDGTVLVSVRGHGLYKSVDGGSTFTPAAPDLFAAGYQIANFYHPTTEPIVFSPQFARDRTVYAFSGEHLFRSTDAAATFEESDLPVTTHDRSAGAAPNELLATPRFGQSNTGSDDALDLSTKGLLASSAAALVVFVAISAVGLFRRSRYRVVLRAFAAIAVFVAALAFFAVT